MHSHTAKRIEKVDSFKNGLRTTISFVAGIMLTLNAVGTCWSESMTPYPEDQAYRNSDVDFPLSPQSARKAFGPPENWMEWVEIGYQYEGGGGAYTGIQSQDQRKPFVFFGGGQSGIYKYIGPYTFICPGKIIEHGLGPENVYNFGGEWNILGGLDSFPILVTLKISDDNSLLCYAVPSEWHSKVQIAPRFQAEYTSIMEGWRRQCAKLGYKILPGREANSVMRCFKLRKELSAGSFDYTIDVAEIGDDVSGNEIWYSDDNIRRMSIKFEVPLELKGYWSDFQEDDIESMMEVYDIGTYLILRDGRYLRRVN